MNDKYLLVVCFILIGYLFYKQNYNVETMANLDATQLDQVQNLIYNTYKIDVAAIKNLSEVANKLQSGGLTIPGDVTIGGSLSVGGPNIRLGNLGGTQWIFHNAVRGALVINRVARNNPYIWRHGMTLETSEDGTIDTGGTLQLLPRGVIVAWSGVVTNIPRGWALCNGVNDTPNLSGKFILGVGKGTNTIERGMGEVGGADSITLTTNHLPSHTHGYDTVGCGSNNYLQHQNGVTGIASANSQDNCGGTGGKNENKIGSINYAGAGLPFNNMPPYYVLAYIMKI